MQIIIRVWINTEKYAGLDCLPVSLLPASSDSCVGFSTCQRTIETNNLKDADADETSKGRTRSKPGSQSKPIEHRQSSDALNCSLRHCAFG